MKTGCNVFATTASLFRRIILPTGLGMAVSLAALQTSLALTITRTSDSVLYIDTSASVWCSYASYQIGNNDGVAYSNLWVKIDSFSPSVVRLGGGDPGQYNLGNLGINQTNTVFFYLRATNTTTTAQTHTIKVYRGIPASGVLLTNQNFSLTVSSSGQNNSTKINTVVSGPNPPTVGGIVTVKVTGSTGQIGGANTVNFTPAVYTNWDASAYQLFSTTINLTGGNPTNVADRLYLALPTSVDTTYTNTYLFRAVAVTTTSNSVSPLAIVSGGGNNFSHAAPPSTGVIPPIQPATNQTVITNFIGVTQLYTNETALFTIRISNGSTNAISLDSVVDTLPAGFTYVTNSSFFNGSAIANPSIAGRALTWSERYDVPGNSSRDLTFLAMPLATSGYATNSVVAYSQTTVIDTTLVTTDNSPATSIVRVLLEPTAINDSGSTLEDTPLTVTAPGVLANDNEPNGFAISVFDYTQPAHGNVTVNANGSYVYVPATNYNGADSFTYTLTNGNARASTATVNLTVTAVNDPPTLHGLTNLVLNEDAPGQTVNLSGISAGPADESGQTLTITAFSSNTGLIPNPTVNYISPDNTGSLQFTPVTNEFGTATITVVVTDDGGTANGGINSVTNIFTVTVNALTTIWNPDGSLTNRINDADGVAGTGYDHLDLIGDLDIQATSVNPFVIHLVSLDGSLPGLATNFSYSNTYTWNIVTTTRGITGFDPDKFAIDTTSFSNDLAGGTFSVELSEDGKSVYVTFASNHAPVANPAVYGRAWGTFARIPISSLLADFTSDADGDDRALALVGASTNGASISTNSTYILFAPTNNFSESFYYVIRDLRNYRPGDTMQTATNWLTVIVTNAIGRAESITPGAGGMTIKFAGVPGYAYDVERSTNLTAWIVLLTTNAPPNGLWQYMDADPPLPQAYYRIKQR